MGERPFDPVKDSIYQNLLAIKGWTLRAENLLFEEKVDTKALEKALWQLWNSIWTAIGNLYKRFQGGPWNEKP